MGLKPKYLLAKNRYIYYLVSFILFLALLILVIYFKTPKINVEDDDDDSGDVDSGRIKAVPLAVALAKKKLTERIWSLHGNEQINPKSDAQNESMHKKSFKALILRVQEFELGGEILLKKKQNVKNINLNKDSGERLMGENDYIKMTANRITASQKVEILRVQQKILKEQNRAPDARYNINVTNSDLTSMDRPVPDTRPPVCQKFKYNIKSFPKASIIIPFYNEALSMLMRTIHSILNRTPDALLEEVILVDDCSPDLHLQQPLRDYVKLLPKVQLVRNEKRHGLIVSRMRGARMSKGQVTIFLDAHSEANKRWLEPLLDELTRNPRQVLQPFTDAIDAMSLEIGQPGTYHRGTFSWDLRYTWTKVTEHEQAAAHDTGTPFFTPTLVGCAIAVDRDYFKEIGYFDEGLQVWGGENIELGFRAWMCGGKVVTVTCSHMGHTFKEFPYSFDGDKEVIVQKNLIRVAETWMDGYRKYFYASTRVYDFKRAELDDRDKASLQGWMNNRKKLGGCNNFDWFLYNVFPQMEAPRMDALYFGEIFNQKSKACWEATSDYKIGITYICYHHKIIPANNFAITIDGLLRYRDKCVAMLAPDPMLVLEECPREGHSLETFGQWEVINRKSPVIGQIKVRRKIKEGVMEFFCIEQMTNILPLHKGDQMPQLRDCDEKNEFQQWAFTYAFDFSRVPSEAML